MDTVKWDNPPDTKGNRSGTKRWEAIAKELRSNPEQWAVVAENVSSATAYLIRTGKYLAFQPAGTFEATTRGNANGRAAQIYARYVG